MKPMVLVVEDHDDSREILTTQLTYLGYDVIEAMTGEEGVEKALNHLPHIVIMDIGLPGISGLEATQRLKQNPRTAHIPVIAHTAWGEESFKSAGERAGISEFLTKPTPPQKFQHTIERCLRT